MNTPEDPQNNSLDNLFDNIRERIHARFPGALIELDGDASRMQIIVISKEFADMSRLQKQQSVYACINELITGGSLHAVSIVSKAPE
ncbi:MAG: BolA/IbaG family iron-sulfur metabolism protein [Pseudomonadales bacterium]|nr:BolA/IbaG family iron-sulfur metabolism protein [Pseudomonadales bacterium]